MGNPSLQAVRAHLCLEQANRHVPHCRQAVHQALHLQADGQDLPFQATVHQAKSVEFVCISQPSTLARSLEKRALSGESLFQEISQLPTVFRKVEFEPVACKSEMSSISL